VSVIDRSDCVQVGLLASLIFTNAPSFSYVNSSALGSSLSRGLTYSLH